jgi:hypothetical protein
MIDIKNMAESWVLMHHAKEGSSAYTENFWAFDALSNLCDNSPEQCLAVINKIILIDASDVVLSNLAAGPVEDLLVKHGEQVISSVIQLAKKSTDWEKMLGAVWKNDISDHVWQQLKSVANSSW